MKSTGLKICSPFDLIGIALLLLAFTHRSNASSGLFTKHANIMKDTNPNLFVREVLRFLQE